MTRRPALVLSASVAARNPHVAATPAPKRPAPRAGTLDAAAGAVHHRRSTPAAGVVVVEVPGLRLVNPLNNRQHWRVVWQRGKREKAIVANALHGKPVPPLPLVVTITRVSPGVLDDDGAVASAKHVRDSIAQWCRIDDKCQSVVLYRVRQEKGPFAVRIEVKSCEEAQV